ncbi:MAG: hypothetical protein AAGD43_29870 [Pseudomonadota bacterium]
MTLNRRMVLGGLLAAPALAKSGVLMPVKPVVWAPTEIQLLDATLYTWKEYSHSVLVTGIDIAELGLAEARRRAFREMQTRLSKNLFASLE